MRPFNQSSGGGVKRVREIKSPDARGALNGAAAGVLSGRREVLMNMSRSWLGGSPEANAAAALGSFRASCHETLSSALRLAEPSGSV
jgi:hypothetical protein